MDNATDKNPLIDTLPGDTLAACVDVLTFLRNYSLHKLEDSELTEMKGAEDGYYAVLRCVEDALRYEADRVTGKTELRAVNDG